MPVECENSFLKFLSIVFFIFKHEMYSDILNDGLLVIKAIIYSPLREQICKLALEKQDTSPQTAYSRWKIVRS